jgi:hypothetical protein
MSTWAEHLSAAWSEATQAMIAEDAVHARFRAACRRAGRDARPQDAADSPDLAQWMAARARTDAAWALVRTVLAARGTE